MITFNTETIKPFWKVVIKFTNAVKLLNSPYYLIPTITFLPYRVEKMNQKRYQEGRFSGLSQIVFAWLAWEISFSFEKKNYKDIGTKYGRKEK